MSFVFEHRVNPMIAGLANWVGARNMERFGRGADFAAQSRLQQQASAAQLGSTIVGTTASYFANSALAAQQQRFKVALQDQAHQNALSLVDANTASNIDQWYARRSGGIPLFKDLGEPGSENYVPSVSTRYRQDIQNSDGPPLDFGAYSENFIANQQQQATEARYKAMGYEFSTTPEEQAHNAPYEAQLKSLGSDPKWVNADGSPKPEAIEAQRQLQSKIIKPHWIPGAQLTTQERYLGETAVDPATGIRVTRRRGGDWGPAVKVTDGIGSLTAGMPGGSAGGGQVDAFVSGVTGGGSGASTADILTRDRVAVGPGGTIVGYDAKGTPHFHNPVNPVLEASKQLGPGASNQEVAARAEMIRAGAIAMLPNYTGGASIAPLPNAQGSPNIQALPNHQEGQPGNYVEQSPREAILDLQPPQEQQRINSYAQNRYDENTVVGHDGVERTYNPKTRTYEADPAAARILAERNRQKELELKRQAEQKENDIKIREKAYQLGTAKQLNGDEPPSIEQLRKIEAYLRGEEEHKPQSPPPPAPADPSKLRETAIGTRMTFPDGTVREKVPGGWKLVQ